MPVQLRRVQPLQIECSHRPVPIPLPDQKRRQVQHPWTFQDRKSIEQRKAKPRSTDIYGWLFADTEETADHWSCSDRLQLTGWRLAAILPTSPRLKVQPDIRRIPSIRHQADWIRQLPRVRVHHRSTLHPIWQSSSYWDVLIPGLG